jgi:hypothetical protein
MLFYFALIIDSPHRVIKTAVAYEKVSFRDGEKVVLPEKFKNPCV